MFCYILQQKEFYFDPILLTLVLVVRFSKVLHLENSVSIFS